MGQVFYPFTFPVTAGPGTLVVIPTLSARKAGNGLSAHVPGMAVSPSPVLRISVYLCYGYAPKLTGQVSESTTYGILHVIAFILMCIEIQITWNGLFTPGGTLLSDQRVP